ncbi:hypothetical protein ACXZ66_12970 [Corynebacterium sp. S7]
MLSVIPLSSNIEGLEQTGSSVFDLLARISIFLYDVLGPIGSSTIVL